MQQRTVDQRLEQLEVRVTRIEEMPARLDALILEVADIRGEMRAGFAIMHAGFTAMHAGFAAMHAEFAAIHKRFAETTGEFAAVRREAAEQAQRLHVESRDYSDGLFAVAMAHADRQHEEAMSLSRALHEDLVERLKHLKS